MATSPQPTATRTRAANEADFIFQMKDAAPDQLQVVRFTGSEGLSQLYRFELELASRDPELDFSTIIGQPAVLTVYGEQGPRYVHGVIARFEQAGEGYVFTHYYAELVPAVWLLTHRYQSRIFQEMTAPAIIEAVLEGAGITQCELALSADYPQRTYCVQYRETDFNFIARLMEEEGIFYFFRHEADKHTLVLGDSPANNVPLEDKPAIPFYDPSGLVPAEEHVYRFRFGEEVRPNATMLEEYDFERPPLEMRAAASTQGPHALEVYDYPGEYKEPEVGNRLAKLRLEELQATRRHASGHATCRRLLAGFRFTLEKHSRDSFNLEYLLTRVLHRGSQTPLLAPDAGAGGDELGYVCQFECIPAEVPFRPRRLTPRPVVRGAQTALVTGPSGEEIHTDEFGRVKVQFHWDREGKYDESSSCWVRVSHGMAGGNYGMFFLPRVGQEVIVDFLEGDPDQPIITGRVYNHDNMPPYALPDEKTKGTIKTNSSQGGGGFNEIRLEDKKDGEQIFIHGQKDLDLRVKNDEKDWIGRDKHEIIKGNQKKKIEKSEHRSVGGDRLAAVGGKDSLTVKGDYAVGVTGKIGIGADGDLYLVGSKSGFYGDSYAELSAATVLVEATTQLTLKCGGNFVTIDASGVSIVGTMVKINSGGAPGASQPVQLATTDDPAAPLEAVTGDPGKDSTYSGGEPPEEAPPQEDAAAPPTGEGPNSPISWISFDLKDQAGKPVPHEPYKVKLPDGQIVTGALDANGRARLEGIRPGQCEICFPRIDKGEWRRG